MQVLFGSVLELLAAHGSLSRGAQVTCGVCLATIIASCTLMDAMHGLAAANACDESMEDPSHGDDEDHDEVGGADEKEEHKDEKVVPGAAEWRQWWQRKKRRRRRANGVHLVCSALLLVLPFAFDFRDAPLAFLAVLNTTMFCDVCVELHVRQPLKVRSPEIEDEEEDEVRGEEETKHESFGDESDERHQQLESQSSRNPLLGARHNSQEMGADNQEMQRGSGSHHSVVAAAAAAAAAAAEEEHFTRLSTPLIERA